LLIIIFYAVPHQHRQADTLLERLLLRMSLSPSLLQRRNLAYCVSELTVTEKGVKKMIELIKYVVNLFLLCVS
jgi:hypothetical protein